MNHHLIITYRTIVLYLTVLVTMRLMGKREIGQLAPFDLVIAVMIAELAAIPMEDPKIPITHGLIPIATLLVLELALSHLTLRSLKMRRLVSGTPSLIIKNGRLNEREMRRVRYNINDLLAQLREKNVPNVADVEFAILETSGTLSVIPKSQKRPLTPEDLGIPTQYEGVPVPLVIDGQVEYKNLDQIGLDLTWLETELAKQGVEHPSQVLLASIDSSGQLYVQKKERLKGEPTKPADELSDF